MALSEGGFADEIAKEYVRQGWRICDAREAKDRIGFEPDLLLKKGKHFLVVEIKKTGVRASSVAEHRKRVLELPNWRFELKLIPPSKEYTTVSIAGAETPERLALADQLLGTGQYSIAVLVASVAIEASLRKLTWGSDVEERPTSVPDLLRKAFESELISDNELRQLQRIQELRNQIAHGYRVDVSESDAKTVVSMANSLAVRKQTAAT